MSYSVDSLAYANGKPECSGNIKTSADDFFVDEVLGFEPEGEGEHVLLHIEKRNTNTQWLADQIARLCEVPKKDVSFAGLKDRNAVTRQWFSIGLAGRAEPDWQELNNDQIRVIAHERHRRKLRRGALKGNRFKIIVRNIQGPADQLSNRLETIVKEGVPNYFGEQRFGRDGNNIQQAEAMFNGKRIKDRNQRSLYLSAARSFLFNELLSKRVANNSWNEPLDGDVMLLAGSNSFFVVDEIDEKIHQRVNDFDIHPSGCLWGRGKLATQHDARTLEQQLQQDYPQLCQGLEKAGLEQARRSLRLNVNELNWYYDCDNKLLELKFFLPAGSYATSVLREVIYSSIMTHI